MCIRDRLTDLPDFNVYADRVWTLNLYGVETRYEIFAMYETKAPADEEMDWFDNIWWGSHKRTDEAGIQQWIDKQLGLSEVQIDTDVTTVSYTHLAGFRGSRWNGSSIMD